MPDQPAPIQAVELAFEEHGPGAGPTVTLLHGFPFDRRMWSETTAALAAAGYHVVLPDLRGHGKSPPAAGTTVEAMARDVAALLERLRAKPGIVVAFSMGGYVALQMALREREQVRGLVLVDTRAGADSEEAKRGRAETARQVQEKGMQVLVESLLPKMLTEATRRSRPEAQRRLEAMTLENNPVGAMAALAAMGKRPDVRGKLSSLLLPALVVVGEQDAVTPPDDAVRMAQAIRGSDYELIQGAAHATPVEKPQEFNRILLDWLRRVAPVKR